MSYNALFGNISFSRPLPPASALAQQQHTIIIGAGIIGMCAAYELARRGEQVTVVEQHEVGEGASSGNAGILAMGHAPLPRPGIVWQSIKWMLQPSSPLYIKPRLDPALINWMWRFRKACSKAQFEASMQLLGELGWATQQCFDRIVDEEDIECEYQRTGWYDVYTTEQGRSAGLHDVDLLRRHGYEIAELTGDELREREPAFTAAVIGACHYADSRSINPGRFVIELKKRVEAMGVTFFERTRIIDILLRRGQFHAVRSHDGKHLEGTHLVIAGGSWSTKLAQMIGYRFPMEPGKGYHVHVAAPTPPLKTACVLAERHVAVTPMNGGLRLAGTVELSGLNHRLRTRRVDMLLTGTDGILHGIDRASVHSPWCGLRPCTADGLPIIDWAPRVKNIILATGHAKMGMALGPITGQLVCEMLLNEPLSVNIDQLRADRF